jgi:hypothetical protein
LILSETRFYFFCIFHFEIHIHPMIWPNPFFVIWLGRPNLPSSCTPSIFYSLVWKKNYWSNQVCPNILLGWQQKQDLIMWIKKA